MKTLKFITHINASKEKVWKTLWEKDNYNRWTSPFGPDSHYEGTLSQGETIHFIGQNGEGMYSRIAKCTENSIIDFEHLGMLKDNKEMPESEESKSWSGSHEIYKLTETNGSTRLETEVDITEDFVDFMNETFPKALAIVKEIAEK